MALAVVWYKLVEPSLKSSVFFVASLASKSVSNEVYADKSAILCGVVVFKVLSVASLTYILSFVPSKVTSVGPVIKIPLASAVIFPISV